MTSQPSHLSATVQSSPSATQRDAVYVIGNVFGVASIVFGSLALLGSFIPVIGIMSLGIALGGGLFGAVGYLILRFGRRGSLRLPALGLLLCAAAAALCLMINFLFFSSVAAG